MTDTPPEQYHTYETNPVPLWIAALWVIYFLFAVGYLLINLMSA
jgi:hypothetical protein